MHDKGVSRGDSSIRCCHDLPASLTPTCYSAAIACHGLSWLVMVVTFKACREVSCLQRIMVCHGLTHAAHCALSVMAFVTYVLVTGLALGAANK